VVAHLIEVDSQVTGINMRDLLPFVDKNGNFQLANYLYRTINELMKHSLDMGTLLSDDPAKLRAYKEQTKKLFKGKWHDVAEMLEYYSLIEKCSCSNFGKETYCEICKGARYIVTDFLTIDEINEFGTFIQSSNEEVKEKLHKSLMYLIKEI
jgi:hypothetical protein